MVMNVVFSSPSSEWVAFPHGSILGRVRPSEIDRGKKKRINNLSIKQNAVGKERLHPKCVRRYGKLEERDGFYIRKKCLAYE